VHADRVKALKTHQVCHASSPSPSHMRAVDSVLQDKDTVE
jgi:hypothetical protein